MRPIQSPAVQLLFFFLWLLGIVLCKSIESNLISVYFAYKETDFISYFLKVVLRNSSTTRGQAEWKSQLSAQNIQTQINTGALFFCSVTLMNSNNKIIIKHV